MTAPTPREIAEQVIRERVAEIDRYEVGTHLGIWHSGLTHKELRALRDEAAALIATGDFTIVFAKEGE